MPGVRDPFRRGNTQTPVAKSEVPTVEDMKTDKQKLAVVGAGMVA
ncbi:MAG: hypothetical protein QOJ72_1820, partial [Nocardioidaceae bacterium]|nr:hypothetical protein [Nocardioidaceae bacterium]